MKIEIINGKVIFSEYIKACNIVLENKKIVEVTDQILEDAVIFDAQGMYVSPGLIDIHTHGKYGQDTMYGTFESINVMSKANLRTGVTSFLPTTMTYDLSQTAKVVKMIRQKYQEVEGAKIIGINLEGPFINPKYKGAQNETYIQSPSINTYLNIVGSNNEMIRLITIAVEMPGSEELVDYLNNCGITVSIGHSDCDFETANYYFKKGVHHITHTYNAMSSLNHRKPGLVGALLQSDCDCELILDGIHVHFGAAKLLIQNVGIDHVCLISDSIEACMLEEGIYHLGGLKVIVKDGKATLEDGTIAGSVLCLNTAVRHAYHDLHLPLYEAVKMASYNPARSIHQEKNLGSIEVGKFGDIIIFDEQINILHAFVNGVMKF